VPGRSWDDPVSELAVRRFLLVLGLILLISVFAAKDHLAAFVSLTAFNVLVDVVLALLFRDRPLGPKLTRWDEALAFLTLCVGARLFA
jgi:hypothetical protein